MVAMASRNGSTAPVSRKLMTYGKPSRKRQMRDAIPLRTAESHTTPSSRAEPAGPVAKLSKPSLPRSSSDPSPRHLIADRPSGSDGPSRTKAGEGQKIETQEAADSRKRKRPQAALAEPTEDDRPRSPLKQPRPTTELPRRPVAGPAPNDIKAPVPSRREPIVKKSPKDAGARSRLLPRSKSDISTTKSSPGTSSVSKSRGDDAAGPRKRRPRLIDALAAQRPDSPESEDSGPEIEDCPPSLFYSGAATPSQQSQSNSQGNSQDSAIRPRTRPGVVFQGRRVKYTYGQSRSILSESSRLSEPGVGTGMATTEEELDALLATPPEPINPDPFAMSDGDLDEDGDIRPAIKSVHELRRAGANNRFADEMEDLLARIGTPSSPPSTMRRNALLELTQKLQSKDFISQFRDHATRDKVTANVGQEDDVISGFALTAVLVTFLNFSPAAHLLRQLVDDGLGKMLGVLLRSPEDIDEIASQKKGRLSKMSRASISQVKALLKKMNIWQGRRVEQLSPQTLALQLLNIVCQRIDPAHSSGVVRQVEGELQPIVERCARADPSTDAMYALVVSILETQSSLTMGDGGEVSWVSLQTPTVARLLRNSLQQWPEKPGDVETATLKLSINMSNTARGAAAFNDEVLLSRLSNCIRAGLRSALEALSNRRLKGETYDGILLVLGVAINILEHCPPARENIAGEPLGDLVTLYVQNQALMSEADSVEKSQLSVAFGYLAVMLGYLSLVDSGLHRIVEQTGGVGLRGLIGSIQEFIGMYRSVDNKVTELEGLVNDLQRRQRTI